MVNGNGDLEKVYNKLEEHGEDIRELKVSSQRQGEDIHRIREQIDILMQNIGQSQGRNDYISIIVKIALGGLSSLNIALIILCIEFAVY